MNRLILAAALAAGCMFSTSTPVLAAAKNYDCSKPGNANKAVCKGAAKSATAAAAKPAPAAARSAPVKAAATAPKPAATKVSSTTATRTVTEKNYDCSKPGNANKAVCKSAGAGPARPVARQTTVATTTRHYDCTKPGNANKQECKVSTSSSQTASKPVSAPAPATAQPGMFQRMKNAMTGAKPAPAPAAKPAPARRRTAAAPAAVEDHNPSGAIAQCKDGTYSHAKGRTGACSRHGGVGKWM
ncbi:DUF3761 domain-containing protein [Sphingomonas sp.]|uniref:DUF3761 domain-containing protein n=1 Tax=Sphingomonas sp. TaxID=28214 RepID=UPI0038ABAF1E